MGRSGGRGAQRAAWQQSHREPQACISRKRQRHRDKRHTACQIAQISTEQHTKCVEMSMKKSMPKSPETSMTGRNGKKILTRSKIIKNNKLTDKASAARKAARAAAAAAASYQHRQGHHRQCAYRHVPLADSRATYRVLGRPISRLPQEASFWAFGTHSNFILLRSCKYLGTSCSPGRIPSASYFRLNKTNPAHFCTTTLPYPA